MPTRIVREGILSSETVNSLSDGAELFYRRLMSVVDDYGRYFAGIHTLHGAVWTLKAPFHAPEWTSRKLKECCDKGLVTIYGDGRYLVVHKLNQQIRSKSKFPAPPDNIMQSTCITSAKQMPSTCLAQSESESDAKANTKSDTQPPPTGGKTASVLSVPRGTPEPSPAPAVDLKALVAGVVAKTEFPRSPSSMPDLKSALAILYKRPASQAWSYAEQCQLAEIVRRPDALAEFQIIVNYRRRMPLEDRKFFPQSLPRLLDSWNATLDKARLTKPLDAQPARPAIVHKPDAQPITDAQRKESLEALAKLRHSIAAPPSGNAS